MNKKLYFEIDVDTAKRLIKELGEHILSKSTTVCFKFDTSLDKNENTHFVNDFDVIFGGERA